MDVEESVIDRLARETAALAMAGGGALPAGASSVLPQVLSHIDPPPVVHDGEVRPAAQLLHVSGAVPIADGGLFRAATGAECDELEDGFVGGVCERMALEERAEPRPDAAARLGFLPSRSALRLQGFVERGCWTVSGQALLGDGLFGVNVREYAASLAEVDRVNLPAQAAWKTRLAWPTLLAALPARLDRVAPKSTDRPGLHDLVRQALVVVIGNRSLAGPVRSEPIRVARTPRELRIEGPGRPLPWTGWEAAGPEESVHRNPLLASWLGRCCDDYVGPAGLVRLAERQGMAVRWHGSSTTLGLTLRRDRELERLVQKRSRGHAQDEARVLIELRRLGGEASGLDLASATSIPRATLMEAIDRLVEKNRVERTEVGARRSRNQRYVLVPSAE